jgi:hypothetical protein
MSLSTNQPRTILGPLTTTYTAPSSCTVPVQECPMCNLAWRAQSCFASSSGRNTWYGDEDNTDCWPPRSSFVKKPTPPLSGWGFYSPGLVCPNGMTSACSATGGGSSGWPVQFGLLEKETAVGCCPRSFISIPIPSSSAYYTTVAIHAPRAARKPVYTSQLQLAFRS